MGIVSNIILQVNNLVSQLTQDNKDKNKIKTEVEKCTKQDGDKCLQAYRGFDCYRKDHSELIKSSLLKSDKKQ